MFDDKLYHLLFLTLVLKGDQGKIPMLGHVAGHGWRANGKVGLFLAKETKVSN